MTFNTSVSLVCKKNMFQGRRQEVLMVLYRLSCIINAHSYFLGVPGLSLSSVWTCDILLFQVKGLTGEVSLPPLPPDRSLTIVRLTPWLTAALYASDTAPSAHPRQHHHDVIGSRQRLRIQYNIIIEYPPATTRDNNNVYYIISIDVCVRQSCTVL